MQPAHARRGQRLADLRQVVIRLAADRGEQRYGLDGRLERLADPAGVGLRRELQQAVLAAWRAGEAQQETAHGLVLESAKGSWVQVAGAAKGLAGPKAPTLTRCG